jgi:CRISPR-associated protein Cmr5
VTRNQRWALDAQRFVAGWKPKEGDRAQAARLKTWCLKSPSLLQHSGAVQALAFLRSRGGDAGVFCDALAATLAEGKNGRTLLDDAQKAELPEYLAMSRDLIAVATWFRRFAQIELADVDEETSDR